MDSGISAHSHGLHPDTSPQTCRPGTCWPSLLQKQLWVALAKGQSLPDTDPGESALKQHVRQEMGPIAVPSRVEVVTALPKTRSGKIMRRVLKARALGLPEGDLSTLEA